MLAFTTAIGTALWEYEVSIWSKSGRNTKNVKIFKIAEFYQEIDKFKIY